MSEIESVLNEMRIREDSESSDVVLSGEAQAALMEFLRVYQFSYRMTNA